MAIQNYADPLIIKWHTNSQGQKISVLHVNELHKVMNGKITLTEIPDEFYRVQINGYFELLPNGVPTNSNEFVVNYTLGEITFYSSEEAKTITITQYYGRGCIYYPSSRIYYTTDMNGNVESTLQDYIDSLAKYQYKDEYNSETEYTNNNIVYYKGSTYICTSNIVVGIPPTDNTKWRLLSAGLEETGLYSADKQYFIRDIVEYNYALYVCISKPPIGTLPTNTTYFDKLLSIENVQTLINNTKHFGDYNSITQYYQNNIISFNGCSFIAKRNTIGNQPPLLPLTDNEYWGLIAVKGNDGANLTFKNNYNNNIQYSKNDLVYYSNETVSGVYSAIQTTIGHLPTDTIYWSVFITGGGNMNKSEYDTNNDGIVNDSDKLGGELPEYYTKFADTTSRAINVKYPPVSLIAAVGDGITDDAPAIQTIIDSMQRGQTIFFPNPSVSYNLGNNITFPTDEFGNLLINVLMDTNVKFSGLGLLPHIITNNGHFINADYKVMVMDSGNIAAVPITAEVVAKDDFTGAAVGALFGARGITGTSGIWGLNTMTILDGPFVNGNGIGYECDLDCYAVDGKGQGILITGIGSKAPEVGLFIKRAGGPSWGKGISILNADRGIDINLADATSPQYGIAIEGLSKGHLYFVLKDDLNPSSEVIYMANAANNQVLYKLMKNGTVYQHGLQLGREDSTITKIYKFASPVIDLGSIPANSTMEYDVAIPSGFFAGDTVALSSSSVTSGLMWNGYVLSDGVLRIRLANVTNATIDPQPQQFQITIISST